MRVLLFLFWLLTSGKARRPGGYGDEDFSFKSDRPLTMHIISGRRLWKNVVANDKVNLFAFS